MNFSRLTELAFSLKPHYFSGRTFHVTFAFRKKRLIAVGVNKPKFTHPLNLKFDYKDRENRNISHLVGIHSELMCLLKLGTDDTSDITFVNIRIDRNNKLNYAKPCNGCLQALKQFGFRRLFFSNAFGNFEPLELL